jgi:dihydroxyacetone kinase-like protein
MGVTINEIKSVIARLCNIIIKNEKYFCELDSIAGDGDFGMSLSKGFKEVQKQINDIDDSSIYGFIRGCSMIITEYCGGASGPIWGSAFRAAANSVKGKDTLQLADISDMFEAAIIGIQKRGGAKLGDKTLLDALVPASEALKRSAEQNKTLHEAFVAAAESAKAGADATKNIVAAKGRASYLGDRSLGHPDAGAVAVSVILKKLTA